MNANAVEAGTVSTESLAKLLMLSTDRIRQLARAGHIPRAGHGRYPLVGAVQGYFRFRNAAAERTKNDNSRAALQIAKAEEIERRMAREDAKLVDMREALECYDRMTVMFIEMIESLPALITKDPTELRRITTITDSVVQRLKQEFARIRHNLKTGQEDPVVEDDD